MNSWRRDRIMSKLRQVVEDSQDPDIVPNLLFTEEIRVSPNSQDPETVPNLLCTEVIPMSPNSSCSFVENSDFSDNDLRNNSFLKLCRKKNIEIEPIKESSIKANSNMELPTRITPVITIERRISPRKSCASYATDYFSDNEDVNLHKDFDSDDSAKDKTYCVTEELDTTDLDTSIEENDVMKQRKTKKNKIKLQNQTKCDTRDKAEGNFQDSEDQIAQQTYTQEIRVETESSGPHQAITEKKIVQETDNNITNNEDWQATSIIQRDNAVNEAAKNALYKRGTIYERKIIRAEAEANIQDSVDQINQQRNTQEIRVETETITSVSQLSITEKEIVHETGNNYIRVTNNEERQPTSLAQRDDTVNEAANNTLTKRGTIRKRKIIEESTAERKEKKKKDMIEKLSLKEPCKPTCKKLCTKNISMEQRQVINSSYSALDTAGKGMFIKNNVSVANVQSRKNINKESKRNLTFNYFFTIRGYESPVQVCKTFFLATLGYNPKNDTKVFRVLHSSEDDDLKEKRGHYDRSSLSKDKTLITSHIMTYNPAISHYRREHAPHRLYLPSDITVTMMHADFNKTYPDSACSYEVFRRVVKSHNISFAVLGNEECELCAAYDIHTCEFNKASNTSCATCNNHVEHRQRYRDSRKAYKLDKKNLEDHKDDDTVYVCVDLQKVVMLPRMDSYKVAIFCPRIIAFNETFAPIGKSTKENNPYAVLWHEAISGRNVHDIVSTFRAFFVHHRNKSDLVIWADNCSSQNKNWTLFSFLVNIINSDLIEARSITIKYLEPGHTFNSADSFHHQVEQSLKKIKNVCDFNDFVEAVRTSNSGLNFPKVMDIRDFYKYCDLHSEQKMRALKDRVYVKDLTVVKVVRGEYYLFYKKSHTDEEFRTLNFLQAKIFKSKQFPCAEQRCSPRGIASSRKEKIIKDLVPLMLPSRRQFWFDLPVDDASLNLDD